MRFVSTRGGPEVSLDKALVNGIAPDGGLYVPVELPTFSVDDFAAAATLPEVAAVLLKPFFTDSSLLDDLANVLAETFSFPIPLTPLPAGDGRLACWSSIMARRQPLKTSVRAFWLPA